MNSERVTEVGVNPKVNLGLGDDVGRKNGEGVDGGEGVSGGERLILDEAGAATAAGGVGIGDEVADGGDVIVVEGHVAEGFSSLEGVVKTHTKECTEGVRGNVSMGNNAHKGDLSNPADLAFMTPTQSMIFDDLDRVGSDGDDRDSVGPVGTEEHPLILRRSWMTYGVLMLRLRPSQLRVEDEEWSVEDRTRTKGWAQTQSCATAV